MRFVCPLLYLFHILFFYLFLFCWYYFWFWYLRNFIIYFYFRRTSFFYYILYILYPRILSYFTIKIRSNIMYFFLLTIRFVKLFPKAISWLRNYWCILFALVLYKWIYWGIRIRWILVRILCNRILGQHSSNHLKNRSLGLILIIHEHYSIISL